MQVFTLMSLILLSSCSFLSQRSHLTEMERDDQSFFQPQDDFPVVAGDEGKIGRSNRDIRERTPMSITEQKERQLHERLVSERKDMEDDLEEDEMKQYKQYRPYLNSDSEKIYFLNLSSMKERETYARYRGFTTSEENRDLNPHSRGDIFLGMTKQDVIGQWGQPKSVEIAGKAQFENEKWTYQRSGALKEIYFEHGKVEGWSTQSR
jgi:hypothetical protein